MNRTIILPALPETVEQLCALPQAAMATPFDTAALTVAALARYPKDAAASVAMLDCLRGPRALSTFEKQFLADRFRDKDYVPRSFFSGATPQNDYTPDLPYALVIRETPYSYTEQGYAKLYLTSGGADSPRAVQLRLAKDGRWYLWDQFLLADIRVPESQNPWA